ncbi:Ferric reductase like transmembrane component [Ceratobasidium sp. AG-Ba]|nr:Ferric reductase like transmembrane component [Ceratobasidium sp. AG-Ba]
MSSPVGAVSPVPSVDPARAYRIWQLSHYPNELWWAVACILGLATIFRLLSLLNAALTRRSALRAHSEPERGEKSSVVSESPPATGNGRRAHRNLPSAALALGQLVFFRIRLPFYRLHHMNIAEMVLSAMYLAALLTWAFINSHDLTVTYWANRAAHLATSQTPLIVALAGKNNIVSLLTGIGYEKINVLHRVTARSTLILIWVHAFGRWKLGMHGRFTLDDVDMRFGVVAMTAFTLATLLSLRPIRNMAYEVFLICHIILVAMYLIFGLFHVPEVKYRFWPALAIWALDRALRALRLIILNKLWLSIFPLGHVVEEAIVEQVSSDTVRLTVRRDIKWTSGQHAFIIAPSVAALPFEAHPFTIASCYVPTTSPKESNKHDLVFIIRARDGFTGRLLEASKARTTIPVYVDGPYGEPPSLSHYSTCVFFSGGSGISYTLPLFVDLINQVRTGKAAARRALFVWTVRDRSHVEWVSRILYAALQDCPSALQLDVRIHVTQPGVPVLVQDKGSSESSTPIEAKPSPFEHKDKSTVSLESFTSAKVITGRPDISALLSEELESAIGQVSVDVSGPASLAEGVRDALVACELATPSAVLRGTPRTTLHVETFGW